MTSISTAALHAQQLDKSFYTGEVRMDILQQLDIDIPCGEFTLIKGPSGCGKSTLLAILAGLTAPDNGSVNALGQSLWSMNSAQRDAFRLQHMGFIFQGSILFPALNALEQVVFILTEMKIDHVVAVKQAKEALDAVGLSHRMHLRPAALSGGEKQRISIACALAKQPRIVFADEPTSALDSENGRLVSALLQKLTRNNHAAVLCVTHDDRITPYADRILKMEDGQIISTTSSVETNE